MVVPRATGVGALAVVLLAACGDSNEASGIPSPKSGSVPAAPTIPKTRPPGSPEAVFDRMTHDFGAVAQNADLPTQFKVANKGGKPLHITGVFGNCGCITGAAKRTTVEPGETTTVDVTFHTYAMAGTHRKWVRVATDDPMRPDAMLEVSVDISAGVVIEPANFYFPLALVGTSPTPSVILKWKDGVGRPFSVTGIDVHGQNGGPFDAEIDVKPWASPPWKGWELTARFRSPPPIGVVAGRATIRTDSPERPSLEALIGGQVSGKVWLAQREVSFGIATEGKGGRLQVLVKGFDASVNLGEITATAERGRVSAKVLSAHEKGAWNVEIRLPEDAPVGPIEDRVRVTTAVPGEETLFIAVTGQVTAKPR